MSKEYLQWHDPTADRAIFGIEGHEPRKPRSITSLTQAEIDGRIHLAKIQRAEGGNHVQFRTEVDALRSVRRQLQGGNK